MFSKMKPLPKALVIFVPIALAIFLYTKFVPEKAPEPVVVAPAIEASPTPVVVAPSQKVVLPEVNAAIEAAKPVEEPSAGMKALLEKGKK